MVNHTLRGSTSWFLVRNKLARQKEHGVGSHQNAYNTGLSNSLTRFTVHVCEIYRIQTCLATKAMLEDDLTDTLKEPSEPSEPPHLQRPGRKLTNIRIVKTSMIVKNFLTSIVKIVISKKKMSM